LNPNDQRVQDRQGTWWIMRGSAIVYIFVNEAENMNTLRIASPILFYLTKLASILQSLSGNKLQFSRLAMAINKEIVCLISERPLLGLDVEKIMDAMRILAFYADRYDNELADEFGAKIYSEHK
jgi:type III secretion system-like peptide-binding chaperone